MENIELNKEYVCYINGRGMAFFSPDYQEWINLKECFCKFVFYLWKNNVIMIIEKNNKLFRAVLCHLSMFNKKMLDYYGVTIIKNE